MEKYTFIEKWTQLLNAKDFYVTEQSSPEYSGEEICQQYCYVIDM